MCKEVSFFDQTLAEKTALQIPGIEKNFVFVYPVQTAVKPVWAGRERKSPRRKPVHPIGPWAMLISFGFTVFS